MPSFEPPQDRIDRAKANEVALRGQALDKLHVADGFILLVEAIDLGADQLFFDQFFLCYNYWDLRHESAAMCAEHGFEFCLSVRCFQSADFTVTKFVGLCMFHLLLVQFAFASLFVFFNNPKEQKGFWIVFLVP